MQIARAAQSRLFHWLVDIAFVPLALAATWSLSRVSGIPTTHDGLGVERIETYRRAYLAGDFFPVWTPFASEGHGSPYPVLYHRLHSQLFAVLALFTGSPIAMKVSVPLLLVIGAMGMRRLCLGRGVRDWLAFTAGAAFLAGNYALTDWFVRGAIAEFTAFMFVPWCLHASIETFEEKLHPGWAALAAILMFYAHMMTFYFLAFVVFAIMMSRLVRMRQLGVQRMREPIVRGAVFAGVTLLGVAPFAAASQYGLRFSQLKTVTVMRPDTDAYFTWTATLVDPNFTWTRALHPGEMSVEIGRYALLLIAAAMIADAGVRRAVWSRTHGMLVPALLFFSVQDKRLSFIFSLVPGAANVQFPCRLLTFIEPIVLLAWAVAMEAALRSPAPVARWIGALSPIVAVAQLNFVIRAQEKVREHLYEEGRVETAMYNYDVTTPKLMIYNVWDGFLPEGLRTVAREPFVSASAGCTFSSRKLTNGQAVTTVENEVDVTSIDLTVHGNGCAIHFSQFASPLIAIAASNGGHAEALSDGTTSIVAPTDGTVVTIRQRSILELAGRWINLKLRGDSGGGHDDR